MPVQLPDFTTLGTVAPVSQTPLARFDPASPWAQAAESLGHGLEQAGRAGETIGFYQKMARFHMDRAMADSSLTGNVIRLNEQMKTETDPAKIAALGGQYQDALGTAAQSFSDPEAARVWSAQHAHVAAQGQADALGRTTDLARQNYAVSVQQQIDDQVRLGASASDPVAFPAAKAAIGNLTEAGRQSGALTPEAAYQLSRNATRQLIAGRAETLTNGGQPDAALALLDQHVGDIDPFTLQNLRVAAQSAGERLAVHGAIDDTWSRFGGTGAGAGPLPQQIAAAATGAGVDPVTAVTTAQIESGMGANLGSRGNIFQLGDPEWQAAGGGDRGDTGTQIRNGVAHLARIAPQLEDALGRDPAPADLYLGHQQGVAGAAALLQHPDQNAIAAVRPFHQSDAEARQAILANGGTADMSAGDFAAKWQHTFATTAQRFGNFSASGAGVGGAASATSANQDGIGGSASVTSANQDASDEDQSSDGPNPNSASGAGPAPMPDLNGMLAQVQGRVDGGELTPKQGGAIQAGLRARFNHLAAAEAGQRGALVTRLNDGVAQLAAGGQFDYDPNAIRHLLPPDAAQQWLGKLDDAQQLGQATAGVRGAAPDQIAAQRAQLSAGLDQPNAPDFARRNLMLGVFDRAVAARNKQLADDPAQYLIGNSPAVAAAHQAIDPKRPRSFQDYATATLAEQARLGVDPTQQHVLAKSGAAKLVSALTADPEHAPATLQALRAQWGGAWPQVWHDMVTIEGGLPPAYEAVGTLKSPQDAALLARALGEQVKNPGKTFADLIGAKPYQDMKTRVRGDQDVQQFQRSLLSQPGMSAAKTEQVMGAIDTLGAARATYLGEDPATGADKAIGAFTGQYSFSLPGGPRVPADKIGAVSANAAAALDGLTPDNVAVPALFGASPALPSRQDYVDQLRAGPSWVNAPTGDALWLMDGQGRIVRGAAGQPLAVPFDAAMPATPAPAMPPAPSAAEPVDAGSYGEGQE